MGSPIFLPIPIALCFGIVGYLVLMMFGFARRHHVGGFVVFYGCLLCASSLTAFLLSEVPSARYEALVKMASKDPPMKSWVTYYLDDNQITWLEAGLLHVAYATVHPSRTVLEPEPDRKAQFIRALRLPRKEEGKPWLRVRGASLFDKEWISMATQVVGEGNGLLSCYRISRPSPTAGRERQDLGSAGTPAAPHEPPHCPHLLGTTL